jgi:transposase
VVVVDVIVERCAGLDVSKADVKACVRVPGKRRGTWHREVRTFATTTSALLGLRAWLSSFRVTAVGMESTGQYWRPVYYLLEDAFECQLLNPAHIKKVPGRKTDVTDAMWIAQLVQFGLVRPSFVPPAPIRGLRDLTRYRASLVHERTREVQRLHGVLEDAGIKIDCVVSDILGVSGRAMITSLIRGERDPEVLAELALGRMRSKLPALTEALTGRFTDHHGLQCRLMLGRIDQIDATIAELNEQIEQQMAPFRRAIELLDTIPGVGTRIAEVIIAETGGDMSRFPTAADLSSWAGLCPGNNESAGRHFSGRTRNGNTWLRGALGEAATAAGNTRNTHLAERHRRLAARRGKKRATVATARVILETSWYLLKNDTDYQDLGRDWHLTQTGDPARRAKYLTDQLTRLGYTVHLEAAA